MAFIIECKNAENEWEDIREIEQDYECFVTEEEAECYIAELKEIDQDSEECRIRETDE